MTIRAVPGAVQEQTSDGSITVALLPAARDGLGRLQQRTGQPRADLTNCAITWYAYLDTQLRAGYHLTLWNDETGKAYTLSLSAGSPTPPQGAFNPSGPAAVRAARRVHRGLPPSPTAPAARLWLTVATSRGSPAAAAPRSGAAQPLCCPATRIPARKQAAAIKNGGSS
jgi:hypothetical protein